VHLWSGETGLPTSLLAALDTGESFSTATISVTNLGIIDGVLSFEVKL